MGEVPSPGCCDACGGTGGNAYGPCWDCRGTGHPHPEPEGCDFQPTAEEVRDAARLMDELERWDW